MSAKQHILSVLEKNKGISVSGAKLAQELSISRNAVWKAIKTLEREGYAISAVPNKGYCLSEDNDILSRESITPYLAEYLNDLSLEVHKSVTSTNTLLKEMASEGAPEGTILIAEEQTGGRGRLGRNFYSPAQTGIYMSILLRPKLTVEDALYITTSAATAVAKAIEEVTGCDAKIKWVNDIYCYGKKVCGILTEAGVDFEGGGLEYCIVGIGINVTRPREDFPAELKDIAAGIFDTRMYSSDLRSKLVGVILNIFWNYYNEFSNKIFIEEYRMRSLIIGKEINVLTGDKMQKAFALDIDENARLIVKLPDGEIKALSSGEVSVRLAH
ncbi:MAG: biotin--[acetyl-CoA-carboxylase] ligase [Anaerocolumna sp.]